MSRDTAIGVVVLLVAACVSVGSAIWLAKGVRDELWAEFEPAAGIKCAFTKSSGGKSPAKMKSRETSDANR